MKKLVVYIHGQGGNAAEAEHYRTLFTDNDVIGLDYQAQKPWEAEREFWPFFAAKRKEYEEIILIANSIGAFLAMSARIGEMVDRALFISPIVNMERLIRDRMRQAGITESELERRKEIPFVDGEPLSWAYLGYVREHPVQWTVPTRILYGRRDCLTSPETMTAFAEQCGAPLTVMEEGEHWFLTEKQMRFLDAWIRKSMGMEDGPEAGRM